jgi:type I restriction enzyme S subunit
MTRVAEKYKQTEVGLIPGDWELKPLGSLGKFSKGQGVRKDEALTGEIPCVRYGELYTRHSDYIKQFYSFISKEVSQTARKIKTGDILFAGSGETKAEIGKSVAFIDKFEAYAGGDIVILSPVDTEPLYLGYLLNAPLIQRQKASRGQGDAVVHISASQLGNILIPLPPTKAEQTAIATALADSDALINSLEKLIAKKRNIKQGAMQKLLKPKKGWEVKKLGELFTFYATANYSKAEMSFDGKIGCLHYGLIHAITNSVYSLENGVKYYVKEDYTKYELIKNGDIVMVDASEDLIGINKSIEVIGVNNRKFIAGLHEMV